MNQVSQPYPECCFWHRTNGPRGSSCGTSPYEGTDATAETLTYEEAKESLRKVGYPSEDARSILEPDTARRWLNRSSSVPAIPILRAYVRGLDAKRAPVDNVSDEIRWAVEQLRPYGARDCVDFGGVGQAIRSLLVAVDAVKTERALAGVTGYVVRQKLDMSIDGFAYVYSAKHGVTLCREQATVFASANEALDAIREVGPDIRVFAVAADGTDVPLPSYEDALEGMALLESEEDAIPEEYSGFLRTQDAVVAMWSEITKLRSILSAFVRTALLKPSADGWCNIVAPFPVFDEMRQEYESAPTDPIEAIEAAEQRLLRFEGWRQVENDTHGGERWEHPKHGNECRMVAISMARKAAKKGSAQQP